MIRSTALLGLTLFAATTAAAEDVRTRIWTGNEHFAAGRYEQAWDTYREIDADRPEVLLDLEHNRAAAAYKLDNFAQARETWTRIASQGDTAFEADVRYNLGNCDYAEALAAVEAAQAPRGENDAAPPGNPLELLDRAIANYRDAVRLDPRLDNARANLELAARLRQELEDQASQDESQQQDKSDDQQEQDCENPDQQQQKQPSDDQSDQQKQDQSEQQNDPAQDQQNQQQSDRQSDDEQQPQQDQSSEQNPDEQQEQDQSQQPDQPQDQQQSEQQQEAQPTEAQPLKLTKEQAERLLQAIRDAEQRRRETLRIRQAANQKPVEKDW